MDRDQTAINRLLDPRNEAWVSNLPSEAIPAFEGLLHAYDLVDQLARDEGLVMAGGPHFLHRSKEWVRGIGIRVTSQGGFRAKQIENIATKDPGTFAPTFRGANPDAPTVIVNNQQGQPTRPNGEKPTGLKGVVANMKRGMG